MKKPKSKNIDTSNYAIVRFAHYIKKNTAEFTMIDMMEFYKWLDKPTEYKVPILKVLRNVEVVDSNTVRLTWNK